MDNNDSNIKPQPTGGLKLMTVFIAVLALHILVLGGITVYHLMNAGSVDADLVTTDKIHRDGKDAKIADAPAVADGARPDATQGDKGASAPAPIAEVAASPANPHTPAPDPAAPTITAASPSAPTPASAPAPTAPPTTPPSPATAVTDQGAQTLTGPIPPALLPPAEPTLVPAPPVPAVSGPVHMPPVAESAPVIQEIYTVKITDSYRKIAHAHHLTVAQLKEANHIKGDVLHTGQKLVIPSSRPLVATAASAPVLDSAPTAPLSESPAPMTTVLASTSSTEAATGPHRHLYTVVKGDTLIKIAHRFKTTATAIMSENSITDPTRLAIGKKLRIPPRESRSARNSAPVSPPPAQVQAKENAPAPQLANFVH